MSSLLTPALYLCVCVCDDWTVSSNDVLFCILCVTLVVFWYVLMWWVVEWTSRTLVGSYSMIHRLTPGAPSLSRRFNDHFPDEPWLASVYWSKGCDASGGDNWSYKSCKAPVRSSPPTNQHPTSYRPDVLPVAQPTVSKHWRQSLTTGC